MPNKAALIILDGWGHGRIPEVSAIAQANTPFMTELYQDYPNAELVTYGPEVGLPPGQMGNSEVGHLNLGAGRVVDQELQRINNAIKSGTITDRPALKQLIAYAQSHQKPIHLMGLLSDGGVHSHISHLTSLCKMLSIYTDVKVYIHVFLDGRDTDPHGGVKYLQQLEKNIHQTNARIASVVGRYYAMDRDMRWERIKVAYDLMVKGIGTPTKDLLAAVEDQYKKDNSDEFMPAIKAPGYASIQEGDAVLFFNYRTDRPRQITYALTQEDIPANGMKKLNLYFTTMTRYDDTFKNIHVVFEKEDIQETIGAIVSKAGLSQLRVAETEKYPHVTFFFSGGREQPFERESRLLIPSPKVPTYDLKPEMSAYEVTEKLLENVKASMPDFIVLNFANTDMVGHTGVMEAAITAAETVDTCLKTVIDLLLHKDYRIFIVADHGNSDIMKNPDGTPHTAHTTNPVPIIYVSPEKDMEIKDGKLADVAPSILTAMGLPIPAAMTGEVLIYKKTIAYENHHL